MIHLITASIVSIVLVALCVTVHFEALSQLERFSSRLRHNRRVLLIQMHGLLLAHVIEIWIFGMAYCLAERSLILGELAPLRADWFDFVYFSAMVYTTVGFGDITPSGPIRMITSAEALAGLSLITWSASFTFLQMQRAWRQ
jgi:hypothetical protein